MGRPVIIVLTAAAVLLFGACAATEGTAPAGVDEAADEVGETAEEDFLVYETRILGVADSGLLDLLRRSSQLVALKDKPPLSRARLERRIAEDVERFQTALRSEGYYAAEIRHRIVDDRRPLSVEINIDVGPLYRIESYEVDYQPAPDSAPALPRTMDDAGLREGEPARAAAVVEANRRLLHRLHSLGRPLAKETDQRAVVDHAKRTMSVTLTVDPGPEAAFGPTSFDGLATVEEGYLRRFIGWDRGERYDQGKVDALKARLRDTTLFESVEVDHASSVGPDGTLPVTVRVTERKHRTVGVGASFSSSEGFGGEVYWEHRNFFGEQEKVRISAVAAEIRQELTLDFRKPNYERFDQDLLARTTGIRQETDAFDEIGASQFVGLERKLTEEWRASAGGSLEYAQITDNEGERDFLLVGVPAWARRDDTDDPLDPRRGTRLQLDMTPYYSLLEEGFPFLRTELAGSAYFPFLPQERLVIATRAKIGSIVGAETDEIPATKRFYAGGGGSIRGYEFQKVGPLDAEGDPLGGRSVFEVGLDLRFRVTDTIGLVPFVEAGNVYDDSVPDFSQRLRVGAGLGFRYFTAIGPVRLDVAFPLNRREGVDDAFQFYISLGQAF